MGGDAPTYERPATPDKLATDIRMPGAWINDLYAWANQFENNARNIQQEHEVAASAQGTSAAPSGSGGMQAPQRKFPSPGKYEGGVSNPAITFLTQCNNYFATEGRDWPLSYRIRWALQFCEGKAGTWAELQIRQMNNEQDELGDLPPELSSWNCFQEFFKTQWWDPGDIINA